MARIGMARIAVAVALIAAGLACDTVPAGAVAHGAGARRVTSAISAGNSHSCALLANGSAKCWGDNAWGQLGNGTTTDASTSVVVSGFSTRTRAVAISAGGGHSCALLANRTVNCWGENEFGQLGNGTTTNASTPVAVRGLTTAVAISAGGAHSCALLANGTVKCWGGNYFGELGNGTTTNASTPVVVSGLTTAVAITAGLYHSCASLANGTAKCWGDNASGQLGNGTSTGPETCTDVHHDTHPCSTTPVVVSGLTTAVAISAGAAHSCGLLANGTANCWGYSAYGQLGDGFSIGPETCYGTACSTTPVVVSGL
jgi:hypothetical protein